jgi:hypothetical protein
MTCHGICNYSKVTVGSEISRWENVFNPGRVRAPGCGNHTEMANCTDNFVNRPCFQPHTAQV